MLWGGAADTSLLAFLSFELWFFLHRALHLVVNTLLNNQCFTFQGERKS